MTPDELRAICDSLNDERGTGGQTKLAGLLCRDSSTIRRKLAGKTKITKSDELAIDRAIELTGNHRP
jgi:DNA-binding transcriptional regulator YdaS (Cro superfamily)